MYQVLTNQKHIGIKAITLSNKTFDFITSMSSAYYNQTGHKLVESFLQNFPKNHNLHVWTEDSIPNSYRIIQHDLNDNEFYKKFTLNCNKKFKGRKKIQKMSIKVGAQYEASKILLGDTLVWLDADVIIKKPVDRVFFKKIVPSQLARYMGQERNQGPETGFVSYNRHHIKFEYFMQQFVEIYYSEKIFGIDPPFDTGAWWTVYKTLPASYFYSLSGTSKLSHVFQVSELKDYLDHKKGPQKKIHKYKTTSS